LNIFNSQATMPFALIDYIPPDEMIFSLLATPLPKKDSPLLI